LTSPANVSDIFEQYGFTKTLRKHEDNDRLYVVVQQFADVDIAMQTVGVVPHNLS